MEVGDRVFPTDRGGPQSVVERGVPGVKARAMRLRPLHRIRRLERGVHHVALAAAEAPLERIGVTAERVDVAHGGALRPGLPEHVGVAGIETLDGGALVARRVGRNEVVPQAEHEDVPVERGPVLLSDDKHPVLRRQRMRAPAGNEELVVENPVVLVGDLLEDDVLVFGLRHHHQVLQGVVQVPAIVHVHVGRAAVPALGRHVGHRLQLDRQLGHFPGLDLDFLPHRPELETPDDVHRQGAGGNFHPKLARVMEHRIIHAAGPRIGVRRGVELAVGRGQVHPRAGDFTRARDRGPDREHAHGALPAPVGDVDGDLLAAVGLEQRQLGEPFPVRDVGDPLPIR